MLVEKVFEIEFSDDPSAPKMVQFGKNLIVYELAQWVTKLKNWIKVFVYAYQDMSSLDTGIMVHHLLCS